MNRIAAGGALFVVTVSLTSISPASDDQREIPFHGESVIRFASVTEGAAQLRKHDVFLESLSRFDRQCRLQTDRQVTSADVGDFSASQVLSWDEPEIAKMCEIIESIRAKLEKFELPLPKTILLIKSTGKEEGNAAHCRTNSIVLPTRFVAQRSDKLKRTFVHELFHILSSHNPELRRELYAIVGFKPCPDVELPESLRDRKLTNPDGPRLDSYIELTVDGEQLAAVPLLYSRADEFDPEKGGTVFKYLTFRLLAIECAGDHWRAVERDGEPVLLEPRKISSFHDQIGRNTRYIIHPDEILADNFVHLVFQSEDLSSPRIVHEMSATLCSKR